MTSEPSSRSVATKPGVLLGERGEVRRLPVRLLVLRDDLGAAHERAAYGDPLQLARPTT